MGIRKKGLVYYWNRIKTRTLKYSTTYLNRASFYLQGQMDIHEKSFWYDAEFAEQTGGFYPNNSGVKREILFLEPWDNVRRDMIILLLRTIVEKNIHGDFVELGVYKGHTAKLIHYYCPERILHLFDTFEGFTNRAVEEEQMQTGLQIQSSDFADTSLEAVKTFMSSKNNHVHFYKGYIPESIPEQFKNKNFAFVHLDLDLYEPTLAALEYFYNKMALNGIILVHDYNAWPGARKAVDQFFKDKTELPIPMPDKSGSVLIIKNA